MISYSRYISANSTLFGFAAVTALCIALVAVLLMQVDSWSRSAFDLIRNNTQQVQLVLSMRDSVQKQELTIQHMLHESSALKLRTQSAFFYQQTMLYETARKQLTQTYLDEGLLKYLQALDKALAYAQPYHKNLVAALMEKKQAHFELVAIIQEGRIASSKVIFLLDKIVESQTRSLDNVVGKYELSRQYTLIAVACVFVLIAIVAVVALRTSSKQFKHVTRLSIIDDVSGTYNRRYFDMVLEEEWKRSMREYTPLSLLMLDIDFFKAYNDSYGHQMGDVCIYAIGKILSEQLKRASDFTARYGGEEFAIVLPNTTVEHARLLAERLRRAVEMARIKAGDDSVSPWVTVSIGVATTTAEYDQSCSALLAAADKCLYSSKRAGRNQVCDTMLDDLE